MENLILELNGYLLYALILYRCFVFCFYHRTSSAPALHSFIRARLKLRAACLYPVLCGEKSESDVCLAMVLDISYTSWCEGWTDTVLMYLQRHFQTAKCPGSFAEANQMLCLTDPNIRDVLCRRARHTSLFWPKGTSNVQVGHQGHVPNCDENGLLFVTLYDSRQTSVYI